MARSIPKPASLKLLEGRGNGRDSGGRKVKLPPTFRRLSPAPPDSLDGEALAEWHRIVPELERLDLIKESDRAVLVNLCRVWQLACEASDAVARHGRTVINTGANGSVQHAPNPDVGTMLKAIALHRALCAEFGLTPAAETRLAKPDAGNGDETGNPFA